MPSFPGPSIFSGRGAGPPSARCFAAQDERDARRPGHPHDRYGFPDLSATRATGRSLHDTPLTAATKAVRWSRRRVPTRNGSSTPSRAQRMAAARADASADARSCSDGAPSRSDHVAKSARGPLQRSASTSVPRGASTRSVASSLNSTARSRCSASVVASRIDPRTGTSRSMASFGTCSRCRLRQSLREANGRNRSRAQGEWRWTWDSTARRHW